MDTLVPEVEALARQGKLHAFDLEWIERLPADKQLAAAEKCIRGDLRGTAASLRPYRGKGKWIL